MARKARTMLSKLRRQSRVRPYRERSEITPLLASQKNGRSLPNGLNGLNGTNGVNGINGVNGKGSTSDASGKNGTTIHIQNVLYPIEEIYPGK